ncbi:S-layer homology domain-containing protein [Psychrobacillus sp. FSL H8-0484]|uniref:S-layer homology domain-containing protein n=1 Tax=Psychrobacillus sp. FSL H8-0484 TaxID=2921390 RepID=UPI0030F512AD
MKKIIGTFIAAVVMSLCIPLISLAATTNNGDGTFTTSGQDANLANKVMTITVFKGNAFTSENLMYIDEFTVDETGNYSITYETKEALKNSLSFTVQVASEGNLIEQKVFKLNGSTPDPDPTPSDPDDKEDNGTKEDSGKIEVDEKDVNKQLSDSKNTKVEIKAPALTDAQPKLNVEMSESVLKTIAASGKPFVVKAGEMEVTIPSQVLKEISKNSAGKMNLVMNLVKDSKVLQNGTSLSDVIEFTITVEKDGKVIKVSTFSKPIEISIPVNVSEVKDAQKVAAYYVNNGVLEYVNSKYAKGKVTFKTNHFSQFVVVENDITFKDLEKTWAKDYIESLASKTIIKGKTADQFAPNDQITRSQFALLLTRALNLPKKDYEGTFSDVTEKMTWNVLEIEAANRAGIILGSDGKFNPNENITRQQMATMIIRAIQFNDASILEGVTSKASFADNASISDYAKENVGLAAQLGIISGKDQNGQQIFAPKDNATRAQAAKMLYNMLENL